MALQWDGAAGYGVRARGWSGLARAGFAALVAGAAAVVVTVAATNGPGAPPADASPPVPAPPTQQSGHLVGTVPSGRTVGLLVAPDDGGDPVDLVPTARTVVRLDGAPASLDALVDAGRYDDALVLRYWLDGRGRLLRVEAG